MIAAVVAMAKNGVIGMQNELPWYLPADLRHFREITTGHTVIMGRKTADSIVSRLSHGLPNRKNIVITRDETYPDADFAVAHSLEEAMTLLDSDGFIVGGQQVYELAMPLLDRLYLTEIDAEIDGDTYFPHIDKTKWQEVQREHHHKDDKNQFDYAFVVLDRIP